MTRRIKKQLPPPIAIWKVVRGDKVEVTAGKEKGKRGTILKVYRTEQVRPSKFVVHKVIFTSRASEPNTGICIVRMHIRDRALGH